MQDFLPLKRVTFPTMSFRALNGMIILISDVERRVGYV
jgi:hypothetical protein